MRYRHNLSFDHKLSCDMGQLVPAGAVEILPGDSLIHGVSALARVAPLVSPVMHDVDIRVHNWYVPSRILWSGWEDYITGVDDVTAKPTINISGTASEHALMDHLGIPQQTGEAIDALPIRAYNKIWNEYYRDQDLNTARGEDDLGLARICWEKDYFTTARDVPQQGEAVSVGFGAGEVPVTGIGSVTGNPWNDGPRDVRETDASGTVQYADAESTHGTSIFFVEEDPNNAGYPNIRANLAGATGGIDINDLRQAVALQNFAEVRSRFGERYVDYLRYLGIRPSDNRLQRPEYLGGGSQKVNFSEVLATAEGTTTSVGDMYGHGIAGLRSKRYRRRFQEHGWVLSLLSVRPKTSYHDGIPRKFTRVDAMEHWQKELELLPWQEVSLKEIYAAAADNSAIFGYVPRYDEYRHEQSYVSGTFRDGSTEDSWHMGRAFSSEPTLNGSFVECTPTDRIYGDTSMPELLFNVKHNIAAKRLVRANARTGGQGL